MLISTRRGIPLEGILFMWRGVLFGRRGTFHEEGVYLSGVGGVVQVGIYTFRVEGVLIKVKGCR